MGTEALEVRSDHFRQPLRLCQKTGGKWSFSPSQLSKNGHQQGFKFTHKNMSSLLKAGTNSHTHSQSVLFLPRALYIQQWNKHHVNHAHSWTPYTQAYFSFTAHLCKHSLTLSEASKCQTEKQTVGRAWYEENITFVFEQLQLKSTPTEKQNHKSISQSWLKCYFKKTAVPQWR